MKKLFIIFALSIMSLASNAQSILINTTDSEGHRHIGTKEQLIRNGLTDTHPYYMSLSVTEIESWTYTVLLRFSELTSKAFPEGGAILIKTGTGDVLEFKNLLSEKDSRDWVGRMSGNTHIFLNSVAFELTREQLEKTFMGVIKIRVQTGASYYDIEYKKDKLGTALIKHLESLDAAISENKTIRDDF